ncbi:hypothetical protein NPIL_54101 [Nephila pilipes]|uniref:Uncharacterized protein n=1 Tax=Nephila pilipes TaxID=299642 RepID=A0A8X6NU57_NEPPI|nr:hypothetical protein NPIL_54101 [Nephila pilipes]
MNRYDTKTFSNSLLNETQQLRIMKIIEDILHITMVSKKMEGLQLNLSDVFRLIRVNEESRFHMIYVLKIRECYDNFLAQKAELDTSLLTARSRHDDVWIQIKRLLRFAYSYRPNPLFTFDKRCLITLERNLCELAAKPNDISDIYVTLH